MALQLGDRVLVEYEAEVLAVHRDGDHITGFEMTLLGAPLGETWLVPMEALNSSTGPRIRPVSDPSAADR
jgi:hypothetical protein